MANKILFHPYEIAFSGFSGSGKTTLICSLLERLGHEYNIGYVKNDAHRFELDKEGKDTWRAQTSGAQNAFINDTQREAILRSQRTGDLFYPYLFQDQDFIFIEGYKSYPIAKFVFIDSDNDIFSRLSGPDNVLGLIFKEKSLLENIPSEYSHIPTFHRDDIDSIVEKTKVYLFEVSKSPLYGLVLVGGQSSRMGRDKFELIYHTGKSHYQYSFDLLEKFCSKVFVSCREDQESYFSSKNVPVITDTFKDLGPTSGILSAMKAHRQARWLVLACDLPLIDDETISCLVEECDPFKMATVYHNKEASRLEPLCCIYSPRAYGGLLQMIGLSKMCPQKFLWNSAVKKIELDNPSLLSNANTPGDYEQLQKEVSQRGSA